MELFEDIKKIKKYIKLLIFISPFFIFLIILTFIVAVASFISLKSYSKTSTPYAKTKNIPEAVLKHEGTIIKYMRKYNISDEYLPYILAQATQESGGKEPDIFQASESKYNGQIGMIKSAEESIEHAMKRWREIIDEIEKRGLVFSVELVLQTYNFGSGYLDWVEKHGREYTEENAESFSKHKLATLKNWKYSVYGDIKYIQHIYRYLDLELIEMEKGIENIEGLDNEIIKTVIEEAYKYKNVPYQLYTNNPPVCIDCSAFTMNVYRKVGINFSHSAQAQYDVVTKNGKHLKTDIEELKVGDLVFFKGTYNTPNYITHVGIYIGNGKMINAQVPKTKIADIKKDFGKSFVGGASPWHLLKNPK